MGLCPNLLALEAGFGVGTGSPSCQAPEAQNSRDTQAWELTLYQTEQSGVWLVLIPLPFPPPPHPPHTTAPAPLTVILQHADFVPMTETSSLYDSYKTSYARSVALLGSTERKK